MVNLILVRCWDYIEEFLEICKQRQEEATAAGATRARMARDAFAQLLQAIAGGSAVRRGQQHSCRRSAVRPVPGSRMPGPSGRRRAAQAEGKRV